MENHPEKHFLPGICAFDTARVNHCGLIKNEKSSYGRHPWHYDEQRRDNPLAADMIEAMNLIVKDRSVLTLAMINDGDILWSQFGPIEAVTRAGKFKGAGGSPGVLAFGFVRNGVRGGGVASKSDCCVAR